MVDRKSRLIPKPDDGLGYSRDFCVNVGRLEDLARGQKIKVWFAGEYRVGSVGTRVPGGCYWLDLDFKIGKISRVVVNCANFGGHVHD